MYRKLRDISGLFTAYLLMRMNMIIAYYSKRERRFGGFHPFVYFDIDWKYVGRIKAQLEPGPQKEQYRKKKIVLCDTTIEIVFCLSRDLGFSTTTHTSRFTTFASVNSVTNVLLSRCG